MLSVANNKPNRLEDEMKQFLMIFMVVLNSGGLAWGKKLAQPPSVSITEEKIESETIGVLTWPLRSIPYIQHGNDFTDEEIKKLVVENYNGLCTELKLASKRYVRVWEPNIQHPSIIKKLSCTPPTVNAGVDGHTYVAEGTVQLELDSVFWGLNMYHVSFPVYQKSNMNMDRFDLDKYTQSCDLQNEVGSAAFVHCVKPTLKRECCGRIDLTGEVHALVLVPGKIKAQTVYIAEKSEKLVQNKVNKIKNEAYDKRPNYVTSYCNPIQWEREDGEFIFQSTCHVVLRD